LVPNHVHLIAVPGSSDGLRRAIGEAHRRYTTAINRRKGWSGHLWQGIFASYVMDDHYTLAAARYVELNPVRAGIVTCAEDYPWSSARPHLVGRDDCLLKVAPVACAHRRLVIVSRQRRHSRGIAMAAQA